MVAVLFLITAAIMHTEFVLANVNPASLPEIKNITVYDGEVRTVVKTRGNTFKDVLDSLSQPLRMHDTYWTSTEKLKDGAVLYVERSVREARLLLMFAFVNEVIDTIRLDALKDRLHLLVEKRFRGELNKCQGCAICK